MSDTPKILGSYEFGEILFAFEKKIDSLTDDFRAAIDDENKDSLAAYIKQGEELIIEHNKTAEDLAQYGTGIKKQQFIDENKRSMRILNKKMDKARSMLDSPTEPKG